ncbi:MAG: hypothetical protein AVDCRST_MAG66-4441, partial [uncultured Pseudonocardia sp.]
APARPPAPRRAARPRRRRAARRRGARRPRPAPAQPLGGRAHPRHAALGRRVRA